MTKVWSSKIDNISSVVIDPHNVILANLKSKHWQSMGQNGGFQATPST